MRRFAALTALFVALSFAGSAAHAQTVSENTCSAKDILAKFESGGSYSADNGSYFGKYQFGRSALIDMGYMTKGGGWTGLNGVNSLQDWKNNHAAQEEAQDRFLNSKLKQTLNLGAGKYLGQSFGGCSSGLTETGISMAAHLVGQGGASEYYKSGGFCGKAGQVSPSGYKLKYSTTDGNNTCAGKYSCAGNGCNAIQKDMSKDTCSVTMPMIEAINCTNYSSSLQGFCNTWKPYLMTRDECKSAEEMSKNSQFGPNKEQCENLSFGVGTGSWSFVLACSWAGDFVADQDGKPNPDGPISDPACIEKLRGMGVDFDVLGQVQNGSYNGTTCMIDNAVSLSGTAVPFGARLTMTCDMAVAMEEWGQKMKALGVTQYYGIGSTRTCGPMRDKTGNKPGTITEHARGRAVDVPGMVVGGRRISMGSLLAPLSPDGVIAVQAKSLACSTFRGVLSPTYAGYIGAYVHFHVEWGAFNGCR